MKGYKKGNIGLSEVYKNIRSKSICSKAFEIFIVVDNRNAIIITSISEVNQALEFLETKNIDYLDRIINGDGEQLIELSELFPDA
ncbi:MULTISPECIES: hypothetical protein [Paenibacillus]|uniref:hypothetical protein n=1 Tax=Paenibacillus TaxID=44249 RepID=UPI0009701E8B|nr:hypothetical protein [Paenibacillus peoriae]OMF44046.1 hypothetical protein BK135_16200 [Paenibacillus peoriae]